MIDLLPNATLGIQWIFFMVTLASLTLGVFRPALRLLEARTDRIEGEAKRAGHFKVETESLISVCESRIATARQQGWQRRRELKAEGEREQGRLIDEARGEVETKLTGIRREIEALSRSASMELRQYSQDLARQVASRVLEREV